MGQKEAGVTGSGAVGGPPYVFIGGEMGRFGFIRPLLAPKIVGCILTSRGGFLTIGLLVAHAFGVPLLIPLLNHAYGLGSEPTLIRAGIHLWIFVVLSGVELGDPREILVPEGLGELVLLNDVSLAVLLGLHAVEKLLNQELTLDDIVFAALLYPVEIAPVVGIFQAQEIVLLLQALQLDLQFVIYLFQLLVGLLGVSQLGLKELEIIYDHVLRYLIEC